MKLLVTIPGVFFFFFMVIYYYTLHFFESDILPLYSLNFLQSRRQNFVFFRFILLLSPCCRIIPIHHARLGIRGLYIYIRKS